MLSTFEMPWGNRTYKKMCDSNLAKELQICRDYKSPVLNTNVRGKDVTLQIDGMFMVWAAVFLDEIEPEQLDWIDSIPKGSVYYDVDASIGAYTTYAALSGLKCFAFEPEAQNFAALEMHHYLNSGRMEYPITTLNIAISDSYNLGCIQCENYEKGAHRKILGDVGHAVKHKQFVLTYRMVDIIIWFGLPYPEYLKIDVDGSELAVLKGASAVFDSPRLKEIFIELTDSQQGRDAQCVIGGHGFTLRSKHRVEAYEGLHNYIFTRNI